jgi:hypothetical protein
MEKISENTVRDKDHAYTRIEGLLDPRYYNNCYRCALYPTSTECRELTRILGPCKEYHYFKRIILIDKDVVQEVQII